MNRTQETTESDGRYEDNTHCGSLFDLYDDHVVCGIRTAASYIPALQRSTSQKL
jgi:hypothetical protein